MGVILKRIQVGVGRIWGRLHKAGAVFVQSANISYRQPRFDKSKISVTVTGSRF